MRALLVLASLAVGVVQVACGQPEARPQLSEGEYLGQARLICQELGRRAQLAEEGLLATAGAGPSRLADARRVVAGFVPVVADAQSALAELRPPDSRRAAAAAYLAALERARARLASAGASEQAIQRFLAGGGGVLAGVDAEEAALGLEPCAPTDPASNSAPAAGAAEAGQDAAAQAALRTALVTEQLLLAGDDVFSESAEDFRLLQPEGRYEVGLTPAVRPGTVTVKVVDGGAGVYLATRSRSGTCFYVAARSDGRLGYATDPGCGPADAQDYAEEW